LSASNTDTAKKPRGQCPLSEPSIDLWDGLLARKAETAGAKFKTFGNSSCPLYINGLQLA
jgi:hypothetical protein